MAVPRAARVVAATSVGPETRLLDLEMADGLPLGFTGGQYIIVDSKLVLPNGKAAKRAYSILSEDKDQFHFQLAVKRILDGPGSEFMHRVAAGTELSFSGPWGKFYPPEGVSGATLVLATDTGITAALGLVRSRRFEPLVGSAIFIWLRASPDYFLPDSTVRQRLPSGLKDVLIDALPCIAHQERIPYARRVLRQVFERVRIHRAFISGDGVVNYALLEDLAVEGIPVTPDNLESFFNMPKRSA